MRMHGRIQRLEHQQSRVWTLHDRLADPVAQLRLLMNTDTPVTCRMLAELVELGKKGDMLAERGEFLSVDECNEGKRLAAELTERMRVAHAATGDCSEPMVLPFPYKPAATEPASQLCGTRGGQT